MHGCFLYKCRSGRNTILGLKLVGFWYAGLSLGYIAACFYGDTLVSFLEQIPESSGGSALDFLCTSAFPLLFSTCAVTLCSPLMGYPLCLLRGLGLGFVAGGFGLCYGLGGCLMVLLMMFSSVCSAPVELWLLWRCLCGDAQKRFGDIFACLMVCLGIGILDYFMISPFVADVFIL